MISPVAGLLAKIERALLDQAVPDKAPPLQKTMSYYLNKIAKLGGYLARASDPPPGNMVMWRGWPSAHRHSVRRHDRRRTCG